MGPLCCEGLGNAQANARCGTRDDDGTFFQHDDLLGLSRIDFVGAREAQMGDVSREEQAPGPLDPNAQLSSEGGHA